MGGSRRGQTEKLSFDAVSMGSPRPTGSVQLDSVSELRPRGVRYLDPCQSMVMSTTFQGCDLEGGNLCRDIEG